MPERSRSWFRCLERIAKLNTDTSIAGHKRDGTVNGSDNELATIDYIETFEKMIMQAIDANELFRKMPERYPTRINPLALTVSCQNAWSDKKKAATTATKL